jgi:hypothetical protein
MNTNATATGYNGHNTECICPACMMADMTAHIRATRTEEDANRLITQLGTIAEKVKGERTRFAKPGQRAGRGIVRKISDKQARYIAFLLKSRDFTSLLSKPWFTTDVANISLAGARTMIDSLLGCPERPAHEIPVDMASDKQVAFIVSLLESRDLTGTPYVGRTEDDARKLTRKQATTIIENLKALPMPVAEPLTKESVKAIAGIYELAGEIYRMKKANGGKHFYAMKLDREAGDAWIYAEGMARRVPNAGRKLSLEECEALSIRLGGCCMCGRTLTATVDGVGPAARFIGPICARNMGF